MSFARRTTAAATKGRAKRAAIAGAVALGLGFFLTPNQATAQGAEPNVLQISLHKATIIKLSGRANNVIIGNPGIADVTVENPTTLTLFGRGPGETNILVLDSAQKQILSAAVVVSPDKDRQVSVLSPSTGKNSGMIEILYACADRCVRFPTDLTKLAAQTGSGGGDARGAIQPGQASQPGQPSEPSQTPAAQSQGGNYATAR